MKQAIILEPGDLEKLISSIRAQVTKELRDGFAGKLMTREEVAAYIGYSTSHIDRLVKKGKLRAHRIELGADPRFIPSEVLEDIRRT